MCSVSLASKLRETMETAVSIALMLIEVIEAATLKLTLSLSLSVLFVTLKNHIIYGRNSA